MNDVDEYEEEEKKEEKEDQQNNVTIEVTNPNNTSIKINDMNEINSTIQNPTHKLSNKNNFMVEVALNSLDKKAGNDEIRPLTKYSMEKRLSESLDNLKFDKNDLYYYENSNGGTPTNDNHHARPCSLMLPRGLCGSDMALNSKGNKRIIPSFNLSLTEGGIKPFSRGHRNNNTAGAGVSFGTGTQSFCYSPGVPSPNETNFNKLYRRSVQVIIFL